MERQGDQGQPQRGVCVQRRRQLAREPSFWRLGVAEPHRIFFPVAVVVSLVAVLLWPAMFWGWIEFHPREMHGRLLMQGFVGGFALGFLGTALPNVLTAPRMTSWEVSGLFFLYLAMVGAHLMGESGWGDGLFGGLLLVFGGGLVWRFGKREDLPPPGFVLVAGGVLCGLAGAGLAVEGRVWGADLFRYQLSNLLLFEGFLLLPFLGIGAFLFPRFFGTENRQVFPERRTPAPGWTRKAVVGGLVGVVVMGSFVVEAAGWARTGAWMRLLTCGAYLSAETGWWRTPKKGGILPWGVRLAIVFTLSAYLVTGVLQAHRVALNHLLYVGGFGLLALTVGTRVVLGHAGRTDLMQRWMKPVVWMVAMVALTALTRVSANFLPKVMVSHWIYAALSWVAGLVVWGWWLVPWLWKTDEGDGGPTVREGGGPAGSGGD